MRTSLTDIRQTEQYLRGTMPAADAPVFEARLLTDPALSRNLRYQEKAYHLLRLFHRSRLKKEIAATAARLRTDPDYTGFQNQLEHIFRK